MGDLTVSRLGDDRFWVTGSYYLQEWHQRWFAEHLPADGSVQITNLCDDWCGFSLSGPRSREILQQLVDIDLEPLARSRSCRSVRRRWPEPTLSSVASRSPASSATRSPCRRRSSVQLLAALREAGEPLGMRLIGDRAIDSLRLEKGYGIWSTEFTQAYTPAMSGLDAFVAYDKADFIGRDAVLAARESAPDRRLTLLSIDSQDADASGDEGVWLDGRLVGFTTSGAYGHHVGQSLALAYVDTALVDAAAAGSAPTLTVDIVGEPRRPDAGRAAVRPHGTRLRS